MAAFDEFLKKLGTNPDEATVLENSVSSPFKWKTGHPIEIMLALERSLPHEWVSYEFDTISKMIRGKFGDFTKDEHKIQAILTAMVTDRPWQDFDIFENTCLAFMGQIPIWGIMEPLDIHEIAFGMGCLDRIREDEYSEDVLGYIAATYFYNGLLVQPPAGPDVSSIMRRLAGPVPKGLQQAWDAGVRSGDEPIDAFEAQLQKMEIVNDWYHFGGEFNE